jgi:hypothetical protein
MSAATCGATRMSRAQRVETRVNALMLRAHPGYGISKWPPHAQPA